MPSVQSVLIPFSLPELTLYNAQVQSVYMRYSIDLYDAASGRLIHAVVRRAIFLQSVHISLHFQA